MALSQPNRSVPSLLEAAHSGKDATSISLGSVQRQLHSFDDNESLLHYSDSLTDTLRLTSTRGSIATLEDRDSTPRDLIQENLREEDRVVKSGQSKPSDYDLLQREWSLKHGNDYHDGFPLRHTPQTFFVKSGQPKPSDYDQLQREWTLKHGNDYHDGFPLRHTPQTFFIPERN